MLVHLKVLQGEEAIFNFYPGSNHTSTLETTSPERLKVTYDRDWKLLKRDRELVRATDEGCMVSITLASTTQIKFHIQPAQQRFSTGACSFPDLQELYNLEGDGAGKVSIPREQPVKYLSPQYNLLQNNSVMLENKVAFEVLNCEQVAPNSAFKRPGAPAKSINVHNFDKNSESSNDNELTQFLKSVLIAQESRSQHDPHQ